MAKEKQANASYDIIDYYALYNLDRKLSAKEIKEKLRSIQGDIREKMSSGSLNSEAIMEKLQQQFKQVAAALKVFKKDSTRKEYDAQLDAAYANGTLNTEAQTMAEDLYAEIEALFLRNNYQGAARKCREAMNNNVHDARIYGLLARSYYALQDITSSLRTVADGLKIHPQNLELLRIGAHYSTAGQNDYNAAQKYIDQMFAIDKDNKFAHIEQIFLYLYSGKSDLAYQNIDDFIAEHPYDDEFRKNCAYDLIAFSYTYYTEDEETESYFIITQEAYENCVAVCEKAASIYRDENVIDALETAKAFGQIEFNEDNKENIIWTSMAGLLYLVPGIALLVNDFSMFAAALPSLLVGGLVLCCAVGLYKASKRPYWQIYKYYITGKRERKEKVYIFIGNIFGWYMKFSIKFSIWLLKVCFRLAVR